MWLLGWTCDWAGPDNFLITDVLQLRDGTPNPQFSYETAELKTAFDDALAATERGRRDGRVGAGPGHPGARPADRPAPQLRRHRRLRKATSTASSGRAT